MKSIFTTFTFSFLMAFCIGTTAYAVNPTTQNNQPEISNLSYDQLVNMSPRDFTEMTGQRLTLKEKLALKVVQHQLKNADSRGAEEVDKTLIYVLCFFVPPLAVFLLYDIGKEFWVNLILTALCGLPGIIHAFIVASKYYK